MIEIGNIITLENKDEYLILEELVREDIKYIYTVKVDENENPTDEYMIFETIVNEQGEFIKSLEDKDLYDELIEEFRDIVSNKIVELAKNPELASESSN